MFTSHTNAPAIISIQKSLSWLFLSIFLVACSGPSLKKETAELELSYASPPASTGVLAEMANDVFTRHGPEYSSFKLLDESADSLVWRLALIDSATTSLDIQTYLWYADDVGLLVLQRAVEAANRGVRVRLIIDDLLTIGLDQGMYELQNHPNIELRLFNPWKNRSTLSRAGEMIGQMERLNTRMHDKLQIADGNAAIVGGRNIGDHYFGLSKSFNFHDLDLLGFGHIARQSNAMFDHFWNSGWVVSAAELDTTHDAEFAEQKWQDMRDRTAESEKLKFFGSEVKDWREELAEITGEMHMGTSYLVYDETTEDAIAQNVGEKMFRFMDLAQEELLISNAYIIPGEPAIDFLSELTGRGVKIRMLTNSLASHDVPAVNSHYEKWRDDIINTGTELYEMRPDGAIKSVVDVPPVESKFIALHTKAVVVDRQQVFIGSMNFDPRSFNINTEAGAFVQSPGLAEDLARVMERDMAPESAWQVFLDDKGKLYWVNSDETVYKQPARDYGQRIMNVILKVVPKEQN